MTPARENRWLVTPRRRPEAALRLFCFPFAVGSAAIYDAWADELPAWIELNAVELPGRGGRKAERPFTRLNSLVDVAGHALRPYLDRPFALFGHSMGALIAFELARWLERAGTPSRFTFVAGRGAADLPDPGPMFYAASDDALVEELLRLGGTTPGLFDDPARLQRLVDLTRADFAVCETYCFRDRKPLAGPLMALGGQDDPDWHEPHLARWSRHTSSNFALHMLPGDHFFLHSSRALLLEHVVGALADLRLGG